MEPISVVLFAMLLIIALFALGGIYSDKLATIIRRRSPDLSYESDMLMIWGLVLVAAFALGLVVMYLILKP